MKKMPKFKSEDKEASFWGKHSPLDYPDEFSDTREPLEFAPELLKKVAADSTKDTLPNIHSINKKKKVAKKKKGCYYLR